uniref:Pre-rRNA-processing protein RIX1 N-terminal domain-containing protein n=1 Tax=Ditylenchus dipsaci TaxID=166011 RepID=A0A915CV16_9BILA
MNELRSAILSENKKFLGQCEIIYGRFSDKKARHFAKEELYWALLAKFVDRIPEEIARKLQKSLQSRVVEAHKDVPFCLGVMHFINLTLNKCPMMVAHNYNLFVEIAHKCLNFACDQWLTGTEQGKIAEADQSNRSNVAIKLATEIYFKSIQLKQQSRFLVTITSLLSKQPSSLEASQLLPLNVIKKSQSDDRKRIAACLWMVYSSLVELSEFGSEINLSDYVTAFESTMDSKDQSLLDVVIHSLRTVCRSTGFGFSRLSNRVLTIINNYEVPDRTRWEAYKIVNETLGVGSMVHVNFHEFQRPLIAFLQSKSESPPQQLVSLVSSLMKTSILMLNVKAICELQSVVCVKALAWSPSKEVLSLLNSLLEFSHDEVPLPLQLAQSVFWKSFDVEDPLLLEQVEKGRSLCTIFSRPKIPVIPVKANSEAVYTILDDELNDVEMNQPVINGLDKSHKVVEIPEDDASSHSASNMDNEEGNNSGHVESGLMDDHESGELVDEDTASVLVISDDDSDSTKKKENNVKQKKQKVKEMLLAFDPN